MSDKSKVLKRAICMGAVSYLALLIAGPSNVHAQTAQPSQGTLPAVTVDAPKPRATQQQRASTRREGRGRSAARSQRRGGNAAAQPSVSAAPRAENPQGHFPGYAANRTLTGTKTDTPLSQIPQSVSVVGSDQIRDLKPQTLDQILRYAPGVGGETFGADTRNDWFYLRGFRAQQDALFLDGMSLFSTGFATWKLQPFGLERLEILRGPSSVLYGGGSPGGVVNAVSKMPTAEPIRYIEAGVNNYGNRYLSFDFGGAVPLPPASGTLDYRIVGTLKGGDTQVDHMRDDTYFIAPSVTYRPDLDTRITVLAQASKDRTNMQSWLPYEGSVVNAPFGKISSKLFASEVGQDYFKRAQAMIGYQFEHDVNDNLTFRQNMRYAHVDVEINSYVGNGWINASNGTLGRYRFFTKDVGDLATVDNQLEGRFNTGAIRHKVLAGLDYKKYTMDDVQATGWVQPGYQMVPLNVFNPMYGSYVPLDAPYNNRILNQQQVGLYIQDQMTLDRWTLVLSGRHDWVDTDIFNRNTTPNSSRESGKTTGRAGLIYAADYGLSPYVSYSTNFNPVLGTTRLGQFFTPEEAKQVEAGVKWEPAGFNGNVNLAWFDLRKTNALTVDPLSSFNQIQNGEVTSRGIELSAVSNLTPEFKMVGSFTAYDLFISKDDNPWLLGKKPVAMPSLLASLWGDYTIKTGPLAGLGFGAGVRHVGSSYADQANMLPVPSRTLGDVAVHYDYKQWRAALNVSNVADKVYVSGCDTITSCFYGERRRTTLSLAYKW
jgi:iron complex outermembrane receptor protein